jgi:hypothetical protein
VRAALLVALFAASLCARAAPELILEAELSPGRVYAGAEARLVLRVLRAPGVPPGTLRPPRLGEAGELSLLGVRMYETERAGASYRVFERSNVIVPRRAGRLAVPGAEFESVQYLTEFFGREGGRPRLARGPQRVLEVLAPPAGAGEPFLPARRLSLAESWSRDPQALSAGEPVTRTLVLRAEGLAAETLPRLEMAASASVRVHHDQPELFTEYLETGRVGRRTQRIVLMPVAEGEVSLPELSVRWWDVEADAGRVAALPGRTLRLQSAIAPAAVPAPAPASVSPRTLLRGFAAVLLLVSAVALWLYLHNQALRDARAKLRAACRRNDARGARDALADWWKAARPGEPVPLLQRMGAGWDANARAQLQALDAALYAGREWNGRAFWRGARSWLREKAVRRGAPAAPKLPPLFRLQARAGDCFAAKQ